MRKTQFVLSSFILKDHVVVPVSPIVLIGFGPISEGEGNNLSQNIVDMFPSSIKSHPIEKILIPFSWDRAQSSIKAIIEKWSNTNHPAAMAIFCGKPKNQFTVEKFAYNYAVGTDQNNGVKNQKILPNNPVTRIETSVNLENLIEKAGVNGMFDLKVSTNPGRFISNFIYFLALNASKDSFPILLIQLASHNKLEDVHPIMLKLIEALF
jgi:pyrrolidone-carboxylate peptidase